MHVFILECMAYYYKMRFGLLQKWDSCPKRIIATKWRLDILWWILDMKKNATKCSLQNLDVCPSLISSFATKWLLVSFWGQYFLLQNEDWFRFGVKTFCYKMKIGFYHHKIIEKNLLQNDNPGVCYKMDFLSPFLLFAGCQNGCFVACTSSPIL